MNSLREMLLTVVRVDPNVTPTINVFRSNGGVIPTRIQIAVQVIAMSRLPVLRSFLWNRAATLRLTYM